MDSDTFKDFAKEMVEYITDYLENIRDRYIMFLITSKNPIYNFFEFLFKSRLDLIKISTKG